MPSTGWGSVSVPGAVSLWVDAARALRQAALRRPVRAGDQVRPATASASPTWWRGSGRAPSTGCAASRTGCATSCRTAARPRRARCGSFPIRPGRSPRSPRASRRGLLSRRARRGDGQPRQGDRRRVAPQRPCRASRRTGSIRSASPIAARRCTRFRRTGQGIAACMALGILENFDLAGHDCDGPEVAHLRIEAMKLAFADIWRYVSDPRFMEVTSGADARQALPEEPRQADRSEAGARISARARPGRAARSISARPTPRA